MADDLFDFSLFNTEPEDVDPQGKAGFTDKAHLKAKGLIPRADGTKRKSDKYK